MNTSPHILQLVALPLRSLEASCLTLKVFALDKEFLVFRFQLVLAQLQMIVNLLDFIEAAFKRILLALQSGDHLSKPKASSVRPVRDDVPQVDNIGNVIV